MPDGSAQANLPRRFALTPVFTEWQDRDFLHEAATGRWLEPVPAAVRKGIRPWPGRREAAFFHLPCEN